MVYMLWLALLTTAGVKKPDNAGSCGAQPWGERSIDKSFALSIEY